MWRNPFRKKKRQKKSIFVMAQLSRKTNLAEIFSESRSGTIAHKNKKRIMAVTHLLLQCATRPGRPSHAKRGRKRPQTTIGRRTRGVGHGPRSTPRPGGCLSRTTTLERRPGIGTDGTRTHGDDRIARVEDVGSRPSAEEGGTSWRCPRSTVRARPRYRG
jgi:hypothetical protein